MAADSLQPVFAGKMANLWPQGWSSMILSALVSRYAAIVAGSSRNNQFVAPPARYSTLSNNRKTDFPVDCSGLLFKFATSVTCARIRLVKDIVPWIPIDSLANNFSFFRVFHMGINFVAFQVESENFFVFSDPSFADVRCHSAIIRFDHLHFELYFNIITSSSQLF